MAIPTCVLLLLVSANAFAADTDWSSAEKRWAENASVTGNPSIAYAVVRNGKVIRAGGIGTIAPDATVKVTPQTRFYIASVTKPFVALTLVELSRRKKLDLDAPVTRYLPEFDLADHEYARQITLRDLMSHRAGLQSEYLTFVSAYLTKLDDEAFFTVLREVTPTKTFKYSNLNYLILERVIERTTGKPWPEAVRRYVLKPLGMKATSADVAVLQSADAAVPLSWDGSSTIGAPARKTRSTMNAAGGLVSTASDLAKLLQELTRPHRRVIPDQVAQQLFANEAEVKKDFAFIQRTGYGLGWYLGALNHKTLIHHFGSYAGTHVHLSFSPGDQIGVVVLANEDTPLVHAIAADVYSLLRTGEVDNKIEFLRGQAERFAKRMKETMAAQSPDRDSDATPWLGTYENPTFGPAVISSNGTVMLSVGSIHAPLQLKANRFKAALGDDAVSGTFSVRDNGIRQLELLIDGRPALFSNGSSR